MVKYIKLADEDSYNPFDSIYSSSSNEEEEIFHPKSFCRRIMEIIQKKYFRIKRYVIGKYFERRICSRNVPFQ